MRTEGRRVSEGNKGTEGEEGISEWDNGTVSNNLYQIIIILYIEISTLNRWYPAYDTVKVKVKNRHCQKSSQLWKTISVLLCLILFPREKNRL
jgi:hypothetical protein